MCTLQRDLYLGWSVRALRALQVQYWYCMTGGWSHGLNQAAETARQGHLDHSTLSIPTGRKIPLCPVQLFPVSLGTISS